MLGLLSVFFVLDRAFCICYNKDTGHPRGVCGEEVDKDETEVRCDRHELQRLQRPCGKGGEQGAGRG